MNLGREWLRKGNILAANIFHIIHRRPIYLDPSVAFESASNEPHADFQIAGDASAPQAPQKIHRARQAIAASKQSRCRGVNQKADFLCSFRRKRLIFCNRGADNPLMEPLEAHRAKRHPEQGQEQERRGQFPSLKHGQPE